MTGEDEEKEVETGEATEVSEEAEAVHGGPGSEEDSIVHPELAEGEAGEREVPSKEVEAEAQPPKFKFKDQATAEKSYAEAEKKMHEALENAARYKRMLSTTGGAAGSEKPVVQARKPVWQREKEEVDAKVKTLAKPPAPDPNDAAQVEAYNKAVRDYNERVQAIFYETHEKYSTLAVEEKAQAKENLNKILGYIDTEARKYGFSDEVIPIKNPDGTTAEATLGNVFWSVARNADAFGIPIRDAAGNFLPLDKQVNAVATAINLFLDGYYEHRTRRGNSRQRDLTVLRRGSSGPSQKGGGGEEEPESIETFAEGLSAYKRGRKRVGDLSGRRRRGED